MKYRINKELYEKVEDRFVALKDENGVITFVTEEHFVQNAVREELTELPQFWATRMSKDVSLWIKLNLESDSYENDPGIFHYPNYFDQTGFKEFQHTASYIETGYTEITPEQFKKWVLNPFLKSKPSIQQSTGKIENLKSPTIKVVGEGVTLSDDELYSIKEVFERIAQKRVSEGKDEIVTTISNFTINYSI